MVHVHVLLTGFYILIDALSAIKFGAGAVKRAIQLNVFLVTRNGRFISIIGAFAKFPTK